MNLRRRHKEKIKEETISRENAMEKKITDLMLYKIKLMETAIREKVLEENKSLKGIGDIIESLIHILTQHFRIFIMGELRSRLVGEAFAMRLRQMGFHTHVIGESTAPRVRKQDLVIVISGSGATKANISRCEIIKKEIGAKIVIITSNPDSLSGKIADVIIKLPGRDEVTRIVDLNRRRLVGGPVLPLRTFFEALAGIFLDSVIEKLMEIAEVTEKKMGEQHGL